MTDLRKAAEAVLERWDSPAWEWKKQGPTADLMANLRTALAAEPTKPSGYAYRHADGALWFNNGCSVNGGLPVEVVPYWFAPPALAAEQPSKDVEALRRDAERYRWLRTRACHGPHERFVSEYGWFDVSVQHEPGFDAAIDAAMGDKR